MNSMKFYAVIIKFMTCTLKGYSLLPHLMKKHGIKVLAFRLPCTCTLQWF